MRIKDEEEESDVLEPRTTPMLREYYTTKPQARINELIFECERRVIKLKYCATILPAHAKRNFELLKS